MLRSAAAVVLALSLLGCGSAAGSNATRAVSARLQIVVWPQGRAKARVAYRLSCPAGKGTLPKPGFACKKLARLGISAFAPVPRGVACTMIYGGPQVAHVAGNFRGAKIDASFSRTDGCQIARWQRLAFLFPLDLRSS